MNDPQSVLRTVTRVIEAELKPDAVVILMSIKGERYMQPAGDLYQWPSLILSSAAKVSLMIENELGNMKEKPDSKEKEETK